MTIRRMLNRLAMITNMQTFSNPHVAFSSNYQRIHHRHHLPPPHCRHHLHSTATASPTASATDASSSYSSPEVYDIAFSFRDFESEVAFLLAAHQTHATTPALTRYLELGCGPARHALLLSQTLGPTVVECIGLDISQEMLEYAAKKAEAQNRRGTTNMTFVQADITSPQGFSLPGGPVDVSSILLGTLSHCLDNESAVQCFKNVGQVTKLGGVLVVELTHPGELFGGSFLDPMDFVDCWEVSEDGTAEFASSNSAPPSEQQLQGEENDQPPPSPEEEEDEEVDFPDNQKRVLVEYGREGDDFDLATQILHRTVGLSLFSPQGHLLSTHTTVVPQRQFSLQEIDLLAKLSGMWKIAGVYGDLDIQVPLVVDYNGGTDDDTTTERKDPYRLVVVLQKQ